MTSRIRWLIYYVIAALTCTLLLTGCDQSARSWLRSFADHPDDWVLLQEIQSEGKVEYWIGFVPRVHIERIIRSEGEIADSKDSLQKGGPALPERIYYIFESPSSLHQHEWNIEVDEPNYVYKWHKGELTLIREHKGTARDKQNRFLDDTPITIPATTEQSPEP